MRDVPRSARAIAAAVLDGALDPVAVVEAALARAATAGRTFGAVVHPLEAAARADAAALAERRRAGHALGPLAGVPCTIKDNIAVRGAPLTAGSRMLEGFVAAFDATAVRRLREAGAIVIAKTNLDEFGMGSSTETSIFGPTRNPWDATRVAGGSSGGSATAVALGIGALSLGTDTGGSVRLPAALCGVVGVKPSYGRVSRYGVVAYGSSLDQIGVFATHADDAALALAVINGPCEQDATCADEPPMAWSDDDVDGADALAGLRVALPAGFIERAAGSAPALAARVDAALRQLQSCGAHVEEVEIADLDAAVAAYYVIATAEASTNLSRYDGVRYGHRSTEHGGDLAELISRSRAEGFGPEVRRRIMLGTFALSSGYHDAYYERACRVRRKLKDAVEACLSRFHVIVTPTSPVEAWPIGAHIDDPTALYAMDAFTVLANLCGLPAVSVPLAMTTGELPGGLQLVGRAMQERHLLRIAAAFEATRGPIPSPPEAP